MNFLQRNLLYSLRIVTSRTRIKGRYLLAEWTIRLLNLKNETVIGKVGAYQVEFMLGDVIQRQIYLGLFESDEIAFVLSLIKPGDVILDVGANIGFYSLSIAQVIGASGCVHAFEPVPSNAQKLRQTIASNQIGNVCLNEVAVGDALGTLTLHYGDIEDTGNSGGASVVSNKDFQHTIDVPVVTLDYYIEQHQIGQVRLVKLDIEGAEALALQGMKQLLARADAPDLFLELSPYRLSQQGKDSLAVTQVLAEHGYTLYRFGSKLPLNPLIPQTAGNLYCTKNLR